MATQHGNTAQTQTLDSLSAGKRLFAPERPVILSVFPGIDLLGMAFEEIFPESCLVRGPDVLWGGDVRRFHPPSGVFWAVIGGPPCKRFSRLANMVRHRYGEAAVAEDLIPEFERVVSEAYPTLFLMENVPQAPRPHVPGYAISSIVVNNRWFGAEQNRVRTFSLGVRGAKPLELKPYLDVVALECWEWSPAVLASGGARVCTAEDRTKGGLPRLPKRYRLRYMGNKTRDSLSSGIRLQGLPADFLEDSPFTVKGKNELVGNGVPLPMGRAIAKALKAAMAGEVG